jgi:ferric-dicitrate binding protein FerR (iron transport regulator)
LKSDSIHIDNLIARYLAGEASDNDWEELSQWMDSSPDNKKHFEGIRFVHDKAVASHRIVKVDVDKAWQKLNSQMMQPPREDVAPVIILPLYKKTWFRIAASFIILTAISALLYFVATPPATIGSSYTLATTDSVSTHVFAGNTEVTLNKNSRIVYKTKKAEKTREIELTGEAFIEVNHKADTSLIVKAGETFIRDIGTSFNVRAYSENKTIEVYVKTGEVIFYTSDNKGISVKAGETGVYDKVDKVFYRPDAVDINAIAYKKLFIFHNMPLMKALAALNRVYGTKIELGNPALGNCNITVTFDNETPDAIADILAETLGLSVSLQGDKYILEGETCSSQP